MHNLYLLRCREEMRVRVLLERDHRGLGLGRTSKGRGCGRRHRGDNLIVEKIEKKYTRKEDK